MGLTCYIKNSNQNCRESHYLMSKFIFFNCDLGPLDILGIRTQTDRQALKHSSLNLIFLSFLNTSFCLHVKLKNLEQIQYFGERITI